MIRRVNSCEAAAAGLRHSRSPEQCADSPECVPIAGFALVHPEQFASFDVMTRVAAMLCRPLGILACASFACSGADRTPAAPPSRSATNSAVMELKGSLVPLPGGQGAGVGFKTETGKLYTLLSNQMSCALFLDTNLLSKRLLLRGRVTTDGRRFELTGNLRSLRDGKIHELYYYCDICSIKGIEPGPCMCCREPVVLVEEPAGGEHH